MIPLDDDGDNSPNPKTQADKKSLIQESEHPHDSNIDGGKDQDDKRKQWLPEEDLLIYVFVNKFGMKKWNIIAEQLTKRIQGSKRNGK